MNGRIILRTDHIARYPWPEDCFLQGGSRGIVFQRDGGEPYQTAFVEAFPRNPNTFLRGEGRTVAEAENACWVQYQRLIACPAHPAHGPFEAGSYTNGSGFCAVCGTWFSQVLPVQPEPADRRSSLIGQAFTDPDAAREVVETVARVDELPEVPRG